MGNDPLIFAIDCHQKLNINERMTNISPLTELLKTNTPDFLYHYTSSVGLLGILDSKELWVTKISYLNDKSELNLAFDYILDEIKFQRKQNAKTRSDEELEIMEKELKDLGTLNIAVASFTENGDQLGQWRGYTELGKGYSLGFYGPKLKEFVHKNQGYHLVPCVYKEQEQKSLVKELIETIPVIDIKNHPNYGKPPFYEMDFLNAALFLAPIIKSEAFIEEKEWRMITPLLLFDKDVRFRHGSHSLIPYWGFDLDLESLLYTITIGPTPEPMLSKLAVTGYIITRIQEAGLRNQLYAGIKNSVIPFRKI